MKNLIKTSLSIFILFLIISCNENKIYDPSQVKIVSEGLTANGIKLTFRPLKETMFYCPGVLYQRQGDQIHFNFIKREINAKDLDVHISAKREKKWRFLRRVSVTK